MSTEPFEISNSNFLVTKKPTCSPHHKKPRPRRCPQAIAAPPPRLGSPPRPPRRHLQHRPRNPPWLPQFSRNTWSRIRRRSGGRARRAKPRNEKLARPPRSRRNQYRLRRSRLPPTLRILPPRIETHCARRKVLGIVAHDGAFAEFLALPHENLHPIPNTVTDEEAVFIEPLAAACEILAQVRVSAFHKAAVLGDGKLAQLIAMVLRSTGIPVVMFGKHPEKLALARRNGIKTTLVRGNDADLKSRTMKDKFPLVVDATGSPTGLALGIALTEPRGTLVLKSTFHGPPPSNPGPS